MAPQNIKFKAGDTAYVCVDAPFFAALSVGDQVVITAVTTIDYTVRSPEGREWCLDDSVLSKMPPVTNDVGQVVEIQQALRYDTDKTKLGLISPIAMDGLGRVLTKGAKKYASHNWRKGMDWSKCINSLSRHWSKFQQGEDYDYDPNCTTCQTDYCKDHTWELHIDQVQCNAMFLSEFYTTHPELDDRYKTSTNSVPPKVQKTAPKPNGNKE